MGSGPSSEVEVHVQQVDPAQAPLSGFTARNGHRLTFTLPTSARTVNDLLQRINKYRAVPLMTVYDTEQRALAGHVQLSAGARIYVRGNAA